MKKFFAYLIGILGIITVVLIIFNHRYPFYNPKVGNWSVGYQYSDSLFPFTVGESRNIITYKYIDSIVPQKIHYIADPFFIKENDNFHLFVELKGEGNADIALLTSIDGEKYQYKGIVLDEPFHLSYPQVFRYKDDFYMLPETVGSNNVLLYKAENFPYSWKVIDTLLKDIRLKDPSLLLSEEINLIVGVDDNLKQHIFIADSLTGKWTEAKNYHQRWGNETRPGGRFFRLGREWYLPLQNRSLGYGTGISLYKLIIQNERIEFQPSEELYLGPQEKNKWFNRGMHHLDIQVIKDKYYLVYDGDRNRNGEKEFQYKRTIKFNLIDIYNFFAN